MELVGHGGVGGGDVWSWSAMEGWGGRCMELVGHGGVGGGRCMELVGHGGVGGGGWGWVGGRVAIKRAFIHKYTCWIHEDNLFDPLSPILTGTLPTLSMRGGNTIVNQ